MKKIIWVIAILLTLLLFLIYRQLVSSHRANSQPGESIPIAAQESLVLGSLLIQ
jgi:hypothetical protein